MNREHLDKIIEHFESVSQRPAMYMGYVKGEHAQTWIFAFYSGLDIWDASNLYKVGSKFRNQIKTERGWNPESAYGILPQLKRKYAEEKTIVEELFAIEIEGCRRMAREMDAQETSQ